MTPTPISIRAREIFTEALSGPRMPKIAVQVALSGTIKTAKAAATFDKMRHGLHRRGILKYDEGL